MVQPIKNHCSGEQKCDKQYSREDHLKRHQILCNGGSKFNQSKINTIVNSESNIEYVDFCNEENFANFDCHNSQWHLIQLFK